MCLADTEGVFCHVGKGNLEASGAPRCSETTDQLSKKPAELWSTKPIFVPTEKRGRLGGTSGSSTGQGEACGHG